MSKFFTGVILLLWASCSFGANIDQSINVARAYLKNAVQNQLFKKTYPLIYSNAQKILNVVEQKSLHIIKIKCEERSFGLTTGEDRKILKDSGAIQFRICEGHFSNSDEEVASTIIHELSHLIADIHDEIEVSQVEVVIIHFGGGFAGLSYLQDDLNEENFNELSKEEEFSWLKHIGIGSLEDFIGARISGFARYNYPNKLKSRLTKMSDEQRIKIIDSASNQLGLTPLMIAAREGNIGPVKVLLEFGANRNMISREGCSALDLAMKYQRADIVRLLK